MGLRAAPTRSLEAVADLDSLHCLNGHQCLGETSVESPITVDVTPDPRDEPVHDHLHHAAEGVPVGTS